jgi:hypothetical protein
MERLAQVTSRAAGDQVETKPFRPRSDGSLFRLFMCLATSLLPWELRRRILANLFAWNLAEDARIGIAAISAKRVELGTGSRVGHFTVCRGLDNLMLGPRALIGKANWITAHPRGSPSFGEARVPEFILERDAAISGQHLIDCTNRIHLGQFATLGGWRSQVLTHTLDLGVQPSVLPTNHDRGVLLHRHWGYLAPRCSGTGVAWWRQDQSWHLPWRKCSSNMRAYQPDASDR